MANCESHEYNYTPELKIFMTKLRSGKNQEIYDLIPEIVEVGNDGEIDPMEFDYKEIWKVNYNELVPVLTKAIQELSQKVTELENIIATK